MTPDQELLSMWRYIMLFVAIFLSLTVVSAVTVGAVQTQHLNTPFVLIASMAVGIVFVRAKGRLFSKLEYRKIIIGCAGSVIAMNVMFTVLRPHAHPYALTDWVAASILFVVGFLGYAALVALECSRFMLQHAIPAGKP